MHASSMRIENPGRVNAIALANHWWVALVRGLAAVAFGVITLISPKLSVFALVFMFGGYALIDGLFNLVMALRHRGRRWGTLLLEGLVGIAAGVLAFGWPGITALALVLMIAAWSFVRGIAEIVAAVRLRKQIRHEWLLGLSGALSVAFGVLLGLFPKAGAFALAIWIGAYALVFGGLLIALAFKLRKWRGPPERHISHGMPMAG